jgi:hypothetical protein
MAISPRYELTDSELHKTYNLYKKTIINDSEKVELIESGVLSIDRTKYTDTETEKYYLDEVYSYITPTVFRGDCFTATVTIRINTNFIDSEVPTNDLIVNPNT